MSKHDDIRGALQRIFEAIDDLRKACPGKDFTIDGRLVGDIGEFIASLDYDIDLYESQQPGHDGETSDGRKVQVKVTFKDQLTFKTVPDYYPGLKLRSDGTYDEVFNGPGEVIRRRYQHRQNIGVELLSFPIGDLQKLSQEIDPSQRIPKRAG